jgi:hypothetical protein
MSQPASHILFLHGHFFLVAGYYADPIACPSQGFPILDIQHNTDPTHGDVCRNAMPKWNGWACPTGCFAASPRTKPPYCNNDYNEACRVKAPVLCDEGGIGCKVETAQDLKKEVDVEAAEEVAELVVAGVSISEIMKGASE